VLIPQTSQSIPHFTHVGMAQSFTSQKHKANSTSLFHIKHIFTLSFAHMTNMILAAQQVVIAEHCVEELRSSGCVDLSSEPIKGYCALASLRY
jgi:hypothetical protein